MCVYMLSAGGSYGWRYSAEKMKKIDKSHTVEGFAYQVRVLDIYFMCNKEILKYFMHRCNGSKR